MRRFHHGGSEDAETTINAEIAEIAERFDAGACAAGRACRSSESVHRVSNLSVLLSSVVCLFHV
jgi:hypothetical protein